MLPEHLLQLLRVVQTEPRDSLRRRLARSCGKSIASRLPRWSAKPAMGRLEGCPQSILVDNSVLAHRCFSFTGDSGRTGHLEQEHSYTEEHVLHVFKNPRFWEDRKYFYGIRELAISGRLQLFTSYELLMERITQPIGRYSDLRSIYAEDVFEGVEFETINQYGESVKISPESAARSQRAMNRRGGGIALQGDRSIPEWLMPDLFDTHKSTNERLSGYQDPLYQRLLEVVGGRKTNKDLWHIVTAVRHGLDVFMTMDYKLVDRLAQLAMKEPVRSLAVDVLTPAEWGHRQDVRPIARPDLVGELAGGRRPLPYYRAPEVFLTREEAEEKVWREFVGGPAEG